MRIKREFLPSRSSVPPNILPQGPHFDGTISVPLNILPQGPHFDGTISVPKKNSVLGQAATLQCSRASRKFFLGIEDGFLEEMEGTEYNIRPGLLAEGRGTRGKGVCIPLGVLSAEITKESARRGLEPLDLPAKTVHLLLFSRKCCQRRPSFHVLSCPPVSTTVNAVCRH